MQPSNTTMADGIAFDDLGPDIADGPPIVFLHGLTWDRRIWQPMVERLSGRFRCVTLDLPGHGESDDLPDTDDYDYAAVAGRVHDLLLGIGIVRPLIVGHSLGGAIATFYAGLFPVHGIVNLDQPLRLAPMLAAIAERKALIRGPQFSDFWDELCGSFGLSHLPGDWSGWAKSLSRPRQEIVLRYWEPLFGPKADFIQDYVDAHLCRIAAPYVAFHGALPGGGYADWLRARLPQVEFIDLGVPCHFPQLLDPDRLAQTVTRLAA